jgi:hypothetical protein
MTMECRLKEPRELLKMYFGEMSESIIKERPDLLELSHVRLTNIAEDLRGGFIASIKAPKEAPKVEREPEFQQVIDAFETHCKKRSAFKDRIRLSDGGKQDPFIDAIMDYLNELENDTRRIEACNNIIKVCRNICVKLQSSK